MPQNNESTLRNLAAALELAEATKTPIELITKTNPDLTEDDAYAIQAINLAKKLAAGRRVVGQKVGLTSKAMQEQFGVDQPDHGVLTEEMLITAPAKIDLSRLIAPRIEAELSFRTSQRIPAGSYDIDTLSTMIDRVYLSMEIIDMRVAGGKIALIDTVSDNAFSCMMVIGEGLSASKELFQALPTMELKLNKDGVEVASGPASAVLGDPLLSVQWVVNRMGKLGRDVEAGEVILTGAVHASVALTPGSTWSVTSEAFAPVIITT